MSKLSLDEVLSLGGNENDFKDLANLQDDNQEFLEFEASSTLDEKAVKADIKKFLKSLDLKSFKIDDEQPELIENSKVEAVDKPKSFPIEATQKIENSRKKLLFDAETWYEVKLDLLKPISKQIWEKPQKLRLLNSLKEIAMSISRKEHELYMERKKHTSKSDYQWFQTVVKSGTLTDKLSALSMAISESFIHHFLLLADLMAIGSKKSRREANMALDTMKDLFLGSNSNSSSGGLLPSDRKILFFQEQPKVDLMINELISQKALDVNGRILKDLDKVPAILSKHLMLWYVEDYLKRHYYQWIIALDASCKDSPLKIKLNLLKSAWEMLVNKPEQERTLLSLIINKFGDNDKKVASNIVFLMLKLIEHHPVMKLAVIKEIEVFINRSGLSEKSQYYALIFLNQIPFSKDVDVDTATYICMFYFKHFGKYTHVEKSSSNSEISGKIMAAILTGISRAFPFALSSKENASDIISKFEENISYLFKIVHGANYPFSTSVQALQILLRITFAESLDSGKSNNVSVFSTTLYSRFLRAVYATLISLRMSESSKPLALYLNVLFRSMSNCQEASTCLAFYKRCLQLVTSGILGDDPAFVNATLIALSESLKSNSNPSILNLFKTLITVGSEFKLENLLDDDEEETFKDVHDEEVADLHEKPVSKETRRKSTVYDPFNRSPEFANAGLSSPWEIVLLHQNYHPTTRMFAEIFIKSNELINYPSDPLEDFTVSRFLDKFVFKNPKKKTKTMSSVMKAQEETSKVTRQTLYMQRLRDVSLSSSTWRENYENSGKAPVDEEFFAEFMKNNDKIHGKKASKARANIVDEVDEDEVEKAIMGEMDLNELPEEDSDIELDMNDFESVKEDSENNSVDSELSDIEENPDVEECESQSETGPSDSSEDDNDDDDDEFETEHVKKSNKKKTRASAKNDFDSSLKDLMGSDGAGGVFASLDQFSHLLDQDPSFDNPIWKTDQVQKKRKHADAAMRSKKKGRK